ncbi:MAG TPA: DUF507 family protein [Polyangiaceae bacterium]|nr:DUF507 family protein [Polyangiaceae bacterium]
MRLYAAKLSSVASEVVRTLLGAKAIEAESPAEVERDIESVLSGYVRLDQEASDKARDYIQQRGLSSSEFNRLKRAAAEQRGIKVGDEALDYVLDQLVEMLLHSNNVDEVYAQDHELRRSMTPVLKKHMSLEGELEKEAREQLKHVREGTSTWEIEYQRVMSDIKRRKGL